MRDYFPVLKSFFKKQNFIYLIYIPNIGDIYCTSNDKHFKKSESGVKHNQGKV